MRTTPPGTDSVELLLAGHARLVGRVAFVTLGSAADADAVVLDTFGAALGAEPLPEDGRERDGWLLRIAARRILRTGARSGELAPLLPGAPGDQLALLVALAHLPLRERLLIVLRHVAERTPGEIAEILGSEPATIAAALDAAQETLRAATAVLDRDGALAFTEIIDGP
jgi:RNA polymerase sigma-70 factor (ECF subfamily)